MAVLPPFAAPGPPLTPHPGVQIGSGIASLGFKEITQSIRRRPAGRLVGVGEGLRVTVKDGLQIVKNGRFNIPKEYVKPFPASRSAQQDSKFLWVLDDAGMKIIRENTPFARSGRGVPSHTNLTGGQSARAAGEVWFTGPKTVRINAASRAYGQGHSSMPLSQAEYNSAALYWKKLGYQVEIVPLGAR